MEGSAPKAAVMRGALLRCSRSPPPQFAGRRSILPATQRARRPLATLTGRAAKSQMRPKTGIVGTAVQLAPAVREWHILTAARVNVPADTTGPYFVRARLAVCSSQSSEAGSKEPCSVSDRFPRHARGPSLGGIRGTPESPALPSPAVPISARSPVSLASSNDNSGGWGGSSAAPGWAPARDIRADRHGLAVRGRQGLGAWWSL